MRDPTSNNAHTVRVQRIINFAPSETGSQADKRFVGADRKLIYPLQIDEDTRVVDARPAGIWGVPAAPDGEFRSKEADDFERAGYLCCRCWKYHARWRRPACFGPLSLSSIFLGRLRGRGGDDGPINFCLGQIVRVGFHGARSKAQLRYFAREMNITDCCAAVVVVDALEPGCQGFVLRWYQLERLDE